MKKSLCCDAELAKAFFTLERTERVLAGVLARTQRGYERKEMSEPKMWEIEVQDVNCQGFAFMRGTNVWVRGTRAFALDCAYSLFHGVDRELIDLLAEDESGKVHSRPGAWTRGQVRDMLDREPIIVEPAPTPQPGRVRVRIAVAVEPDGSWSASGWSGANVDTVKAAVSDSMGSDDIRWSWVEADVPMPEPEETVQGVVAGLIEAKLGREDCDSFEPGEPKGQCDGDGHFLCRRCKEWNKPLPSPREG